MNKRRGLLLPLSAKQQDVVRVVRRENGVPKCRYLCKCGITFQNRSVYRNHLKEAARLREQQQKSSTYTTRESFQQPVRDRKSLEQRVRRLYKSGCECNPPCFDDWKPKDLKAFLKHKWKLTPSEKRRCLKEALLNLESTEDNANSRRVCSHYFELKVNL